MRLKLAHYRNRFSMFRTYYALRAGLVKADGIDFTITEVPDPPSRELEDVLFRGEVDISNVYLPNFLERRLDGAPIIGLCTEWKSTGKGNGLFVRRNEIRGPAEGFDFPIPQTPRNSGRASAASSSIPRGAGAADVGIC